MNVTLTSLEALIRKYHQLIYITFRTSNWSYKRLAKFLVKATHESLPCPDAAALEAFCAIMRDSVEGPMMAAQTLAARMHTPNAREALLALCMLDRCMRRCDASFHAEVGKFRFLNEMIKLVSPKYFADRTAPEVRTRVSNWFYLKTGFNCYFYFNNKYLILHGVLQCFSNIFHDPLSMKNIWIQFFFIFLNTVQHSSLFWNIPLILFQCFR